MMLAMHMHTYIRSDKYEGYLRSTTQRHAYEMESLVGELKADTDLLSNMKYILSWLAAKYGGSPYKNTQQLINSLNKSIPDYA